MRGNTIITQGLSVCVSPHVCDQKTWLFTVLLRIVLSTARFCDSYSSNDVYKAGRDFCRVLRHGFLIAGRPAWVRTLR